MRKIIAAVAGICSFFLLLTACSQQGNGLFDISSEVFPSEDINFVTEKESYSLQDEVIRYSITNTGAEELCIAGDDNCFELHKLVDGEWKRVGEKTEHYWNSLGQVLKPGQTEEREIKLEEYYSLPLEKGEYRIVSEGLVSGVFEIV